MSFGIGSGLMANFLIVEDEEQVRVLAESCLQGEGHDTLSASTVSEALALLEGDAKVDILFTELGLRGNPNAGLDLAIKAAERRPDLKILYTSGQGVTDGMKALFVEDAAFLPKPYTIDQLQTSLVVNFGIKPNSR
jgi:DNA-binding NtrC family response regulator